MQTFKHISTAANEAVEYIDKRRQGLERSLRFSHEKLNSRLLNGIP